MNFKVVLTCSLLVTLNAGTQAVFAHGNTPEVRSQNTAIPLSISMVSAIDLTVHTDTSVLQCGAASPLLIEHGLNDYLLENTPRTKATELSRTVMGFLQKIQQMKFMSGRGTRTECFGTEPNIRSETSWFALEHVEQHSLSDSGIGFRVLEIDKENRISRSNKIHIPLEGRTIDVSFDESPLAGTLTASYRFRQATLAGTLFKEIALNVAQVEDHLRVMEHIYVNGTLAERSIWEFSMKK